MSNWMWVASYALAALIMGVFLVRAEASIRAKDSGKRLDAGEWAFNMSLGIVWPILVILGITYFFVEVLPNSKTGEKMLRGPITVWRFIFEPKDAREAIKSKVEERRNTTW